MFGPGSWARKYSWSGRSTGSFLNRSASIRLKIAVFPPMPSASDTIAAVVNIGVFLIVRNA